MATIASQATGNWSSTSTWSGGVIPGAADVAQVVTGHVVTIDQDISVQGLSNTGDGKFVVTGSAVRSIICGSAGMSLSVTATGSALLEFDAGYSATGSTVTTGNISVGAHTGTTALGVITMLAGATGSVSFSGGSWQGDSNATGVEPYVLYTNSAVDITVTLTGSLSSASAVGAYTLGSLSAATGNITLTATNIQNGLFLQGTKTVVVNATLVTANGVNLSVFSGTITINSNVQAAQGGGGQSGSPGMSVNSGSPTIIINGNVSGGTSATNGQQFGLYISQATNYNLTVNGNVTGASGTTNGSSGITVQPSGNTNGTIVITGNVAAGTALYSPGLSMGSSGTVGPSYLTVYGDVTAGGNGTSAYDGVTLTGSNTTSAIYATIKGNIKGGIINNAQGVVVNNYSHLLLESDVISGGDTVAMTAGVLMSITASTTSTVRLGQAGSLVTLNNYTLSPAIKGAYMIVDGTEVISNFITMNPILGTPENLVPPLTNMASSFNPADVRDGVTYDGSSVGTMSIPDPEDVLYGVPVDDTVGTAHLTMADAAAITGSQIASLST